MSGTIWGIGEAAGPILARILIEQIGYKSALDVTAAIIAATPPVGALNYSDGSA